MPVGFRGTVAGIGVMIERREMKYTTRAQANHDRTLLIEAIEENGTFGERIWLPLLRFVHKRELRKEAALYAPRR